MSTVVLNHLSTEIRENIHQLEQIVHQADQTYRWLFLSNQYNFNQTMPFLVLNYQQNQLVGVGTIYAEDNELAEVAVIVHPQYRHQHRARKIISQIKKICRDYQIKEIGYKTETRFYQQHPDYFNQYVINREAEPEVILEFGIDHQLVNETLGSLLCESDDSLIQVSQVLPQEYPKIAQILADCFDESYDGERQFVEQIAGDDTMVLFRFYSQNEIIGTCSIEVHPKVVYLFAVAIKKSHQNKGIGTNALARLTTYLTEKYNRPLQIQAEIDNQRAIKVYQKLGFKLVSEWIELIEK